MHITKSRIIHECPFFNGNDFILRFRINTFNAASHTTSLKRPYFYILLGLLFACSDQKERAIEHGLKKAFERRGYSLGAYSIVGEEKLKDGLALVSIQTQLRGEDGLELHELATIKMYQRGDGKWSVVAPE